MNMTDTEYDALTGTVSVQYSYTVPVAPGVGYRYTYTAIDLGRPDRVHREWEEPLVPRKTKEKPLSGAHQGRLWRDQHRIRVIEAELRRNPNASSELLASLVGVGRSTIRRIMQEYPGIATEGKWAQEENLT